MIIVIFEPGMGTEHPQIQNSLKILSEIPNTDLTTETVYVNGLPVVEAYLSGAVENLHTDDLTALQGVAKAVSLASKHPLLKQPGNKDGFTYRGIHFSQDSLHLFPGLCAVDTPSHVEEMMQELAANQIRCTRMGAYKPRTNPYTFQGHGAQCLPYLFELAGRYDIQLIAMEITHERQIEEITHALEEAGNPTGVMLQIGTRNAQNFELLRAAGRQNEFPILYKRGFGVTLNDSLQAAEYIAQSGNTNIIFCLRGVQTQLGQPHRNLSDFALIPAIKRATYLPVCVDPSHAIGCRERGSDNIPELLHAAAQGVIAGCNMVLIDFHPHPERAYVDGRQSLRALDLKTFIDDVTIVREAYLKRQQLYSAL